MKSNWVLKLINLALFVFGAAFVVLHVEFNEGNFLYYFFKAQGGFKCEVQQLMKFSF